MNADLALCIRLILLISVHPKLFNSLPASLKMGSDYHEFDRLAKSYYKESKAPASQPMNAKYADDFNVQLKDSKYKT